MPARELANAFEKGTLSPIEATKSVLARIEAFEPKLNAMHIIDAEGALDAAVASEARWRAGKPLSPLDGVPITIKDNIATAGFPTPIGIAANRDIAATTVDSPQAARVREAGLVIIGKTTMPDFGMLSSGVSSLHGITRNPWNTERNTGGSSSGAGAAVAAGYGPLALGTDIGGSVRLPAAACGIVGFKASQGRIPVYPPFLGRCTGPMTRSVADAAALLTILSKPDVRDYTSLPYDPVDYVAGLDSLEVNGLKIGLLTDVGIGLPVDEEIKIAIERVAGELAAAGAHVQPMEPFLGAREAHSIDLFFRARLLAMVDAMPALSEGAFLPFIAEWIEGARDKTAAQAMGALETIFEIRDRTVQATMPFDFVISPTSPITAYAAELPCPTNDPARPFDHVVFTAPFNQSEQPALSIPAGFSSENLPIGLQIVGRRFDDRGVLRLGKALESMIRIDRPFPQP